MQLITLHTHTHTHTSARARRHTHTPAVYHNWSWRQVQLLQLLLLLVHIIKVGQHLGRVLGDPVVGPGSKVEVVYGTRLLLHEQKRSGGRDDSHVAAYVHTYIRTHVHGTIIPMCTVEPLTITDTIGTQLAVLV